jgi:signal transduction histidine kinase
MLHEFIGTYRSAIIAKTRRKVAIRRWPTVSSHELEHGVPLFLTQLSDILRWEMTRATAHGDAILTSSAAQHGRELLAEGFTVAQVVHDYGDVCQSITELAMADNVPITAAEFNILNRCLDVAIAEAVTEHARLTAVRRAAEEQDRAQATAAQTAHAEVARLGGLMHEVRDNLNTALLAFHTLKRGTVAINGSTGAVLGRSLTGLRDFVNSALADVRMSTSQPDPELVTVEAVLSDIAEASALHADYHHVEFVLEPVDPSLTLRVDRQLVTSALMNLLNNAFKFTPPGRRIVLSTQRAADRVLISVADACGGIPETRGDPFQPFGERRGGDRSGLGLGLSLARKAIRAHGGDISVRNIAGEGCVFTIELGLLDPEDVRAIDPTLT